MQILPTPTPPNRHYIDYRSVDLEIDEVSIYSHVIVDEHVIYH